MVTLNLKNNKNLPNKNSLSFFYAIYDIYFNKHQPINDTEMVKILKKDYNLDIERRTIKRYRDFLINNFDIELTHEKKGYYVKPKVDNQKIQIIKNIIDNNEHENHLLLFKYINRKIEAYPLKISIIDNEPFLVCVIDQGDGRYDITTFNINHITLIRPYLTSYGLNIDLCEYGYNYGYDFTGTIDTFYNLDETYSIDVTLVFKKEAPIKEIKKKISNEFEDVTIGRRMVNKQRYYAISFSGEHKKVVDFTINQLRTIKKIISPELRDEIKVLLCK